MRQIEVLCVSDDGAYLLLASSADAARATHRLPVDDRLRAALNGELDAAGRRRSSSIPPREIQARLRAGETVEQLAKAADMPLGRVQRYAGPVESERERILDQARAAMVRRPRGPASTMTLDEVVTRHLAGVTGLRAESLTWTASRREDGGWVVALRYAARGGTRGAQWLWRPTERELTVLDLAASRLSAPDAEPAGSRRSSAPRSAPPRVDAIVDAARSTPARKPTTPKPAPQPAVSKKAVSTTARSRTARSTTARSTTAASRTPASATAAATRAPVRGTSAAAADGTPRVSAVKRAAAIRRGSAGRTAAPEQPSSATEPRRGGRVPVPSWSDVLFGVQGEAPPAAARATPAKDARAKAARTRGARGRRTE